MMSFEDSPTYDDTAFGNINTIINVPIDCEDDHFCGFQITKPTQYLTKTTKIYHELFLY